jgi:hypothetical protein
MSMGTERVVWHYNRVKIEDRTSLKLETINNILHTAKELYFSIQEKQLLNS